METTERNEAVERVWRRLPSEARDALMVGMAPTDLQTLLLSVSRARAEQVAASRLMQRWREDRFVRPSATDPRQLAELDAYLWQHLPAELKALCSPQSLRSAAVRRQPTSIRTDRVDGAR